ncbi:MAG: helix-turn-helix domain-containing protein [Pirellulales bacterium]|nr:helix-turn-helix domain-containing protein [Pirellulales bacterium]
MNISTTNLTPMKAVTQMRAVFDGFAARYAAARVARGADPRALLKVFAEMQQSVQDDEHFAELDRKLHYTIAELADVRGLTDVWQVVTREQDAFRRATLRECWPDMNVLFEAHRRIVDAICAGDPITAEEAAQAHFDALWYRLADLTNDPSLPDDPLARACTYLAFHLHEPIRLTFLAQYIAKLSPGHLARLFREGHGKSFTEYLRDLRMQRAIKMLIHTRRPISQIATSVGYLDCSRFSRHFSKKYGLSPRAYRKRFSGEASKA